MVQTIKIKAVKFEDILRNRRNCFIETGKFLISMHTLAQPWGSKGTSSPPKPSHLKNLCKNTKIQVFKSVLNLTCK